MFGFLKKLVDRPTTIHVVGLETGVAQFRSSKRLRPGTSHQCAAVFPGGQQFLVDLLVQEAQPGGLYTGQLGPRELLPRMAEAFARGTNQRYYKVEEMEATHHFRTYVVRSRDIPNYKGVTTDLSTTEARLALDGPMPIGKTLELSLEIDDQRMPALTLRCQVVATSPIQGGGCQVDVRWSAMTPKQEALLKSHLSKLKQDVEIDHFKREV